MSDQISSIPDPVGILSPKILIDEGKKNFDSLLFSQSNHSIDLNETSFVPDPVSPLLTPSIDMSSLDIRRFDLMPENAHKSRVSPADNGK